MRDQGEPSKHLGMNITYDESGIYLNHEDYITSLLEKFEDIGPLHATKIPMEADKALSGYARSQETQVSIPRSTNN